MLKRFVLALVIAASVLTITQTPGDASTRGRCYLVRANAHVDFMTTNGVTEYRLVTVRTYKGRACPHSPMTLTHKTAFAPVPTN